MRKYKINVVLLVIFLVILITGCDYLPSPYDVIRAPIGTNTDKIEIDVSRFIPDEMVLLNASNSGSKYIMRFTDIENDGREELVVFYGDPDTFKCKGVMILKYEDEWTEYYVNFFAEGTRYSVENVKFIDLTGDGYREMLIEMSSFNDIRIFSIMRFIDGIEKLYTFGVDKVEVLYKEKAVPELALWKEGEPELFNIEILRWEDDGFVLSTYDSPGYFLQVVPSLLKKLDKKENYRMTRLYYADALLKAGDYQNALENAEHFLLWDYEEGSTDKVKAHLIKGRCLYNLGLIEEAQDALEMAGTFPDYNIETYLELQCLLCDILIGNEEYEEAKIKLDDIKSFTQQFLNSDYKYHIWNKEYERRMLRLEDARED